jgi:hypothetical protein
MNKKIYSQCGTLTQLLEMCEVNSIFGSKKVLDINHIDPNILGTIISFIKNEKLMVCTLPNMDIEQLVRIIKSCDYLQCNKLLSVCATEMNKRLRHLHTLPDLQYVSLLF